MWRVLLLPLLLVLPAAAQESPVCDASRAGAAACMAGKLCLCGFQRGGTLSGRPEGWRWDCGALRPACGEALPPAGLAPAFPIPPPDLLLQLPPPGAMPPPDRFTPWPGR